MFIADESLRSRHSFRRAMFRTSTFRSERSEDKYRAVPRLQTFHSSGVKTNLWLIGLCVILQAD